MPQAGRAAGERGKGRVPAEGLGVHAVLGGGSPPRWRAAFACLCLYFGKRRTARQLLAGGAALGVLVAYSAQEGSEWWCHERFPSVGWGSHVHGWL